MPAPAAAHPPPPDRPEWLRRPQRRAAFVGVVALALCLVGYLFQRERFGQSWLFAWNYWTGLSLGCLAWLLLPVLVGGRWGWAVRRLATAGVSALPLMLVLALPFLLAPERLFSWARPEAVAAHPEWTVQPAYYNPTAYLARTFGYFAVYGLVAVGAIRGLRAREAGRRPRTLGACAAWGLVLYGFSMLFAGADWVTAVEPGWRSTMFPVTLMVSHLLSALALLTLCLVLLHPRLAADRVAGADLVGVPLLHDLGNLLLGLVPFWAYTEFFQFTVVWMGNLPEEINWYQHRTADGWQLVLLFLTAVGFVLPFLLLLLRPVKRNPFLLGAVAALVLLVQAVDNFWRVVPAFHPRHLAVSWLDVTVFVAQGGLWLGVFLTVLLARGVLPPPEPGTVDEPAAAETPAAGAAGLDPAPHRA